jgi:hypothetical protein
MGDFLGAVVDLIFGKTGQLNGPDSRFSLLVFAVVCAIMGLLVVLLDWTYFSIQRKSILQISYVSFGGSLRLVCLWGLGAGVGGYLGAAANILSASDKP